MYKQASVRTLLEFRQDFITSEEKDSITLRLELHSTKIRQQNLVSHGHTTGNKFSILGTVPRTHSEHLTFIGLLVPAIGQKEAAGSLRK